MRIVVAVEGMWGERLKILEFIELFYRSSGEYDLIIALDGNSSDFIDHLRGTIDTLLPQDHIRLWFSPAATEGHKEIITKSSQEVTGIVVGGFLKSLDPDILVIAEESGCGHGQLSAAMSHLDAGLTIVVLLPEFPSDEPAGQLGSDHNEIFKKGKYYVAPNGRSRHLWTSILGVEEKYVVALTENGYESPEHQARVVLDTFKRWHGTESNGFLLPQQSNFRQKLAYVSPLPPERSGISDYSAELLPELGRYYEIDVVVEQENVSTSWVLENCQVRNVTWFREHAGDYDRVLYHFGNSPFHLHMFSLLAEVPGVVVLHDFFLSNILEHRDSTIQRFASTLFRSHGYTAVQKLFCSEHGGSDIVDNYPCNFDIFQQAEGVIFHSEYAKKLSATWYGSIVSNRSTIVPLLRSSVLEFDRIEARHALGFREDDFIVCSFGMPGAYKLSQLLLEAWRASSLGANEHCVLIFVGDLHDNEYVNNLRYYIEHNNSGMRVIMTDWVPMDDYRRYLASSNIGVQLRTLSRGESSASALDCLNYGLATIVNANGSLAELPRECVMMLPDLVTVDDLRVALETLYSDSALRLELGNNAHAFIMNERSPVSIAKSYAAAIERFSYSPVAIRNTIAKRIAGDTAIPDVEPTLFSLQMALDSTFQRPMQRQLLIDVSALVLIDLKTGIQRVIRSIVKTLIDNPPDGFRIEPVYAASDAPYRYARKFTLNSIGCTDDILVDDLVEIRPNDILFVPDLHFQVAQSHKDYYQKIRNEGVSVFFLVHDILPIRHPEFFPDGTFDDFKNWLNVVVRSDGAICVSRTVAQDLHNWLNQLQLKRVRPFALGWNHHGADIASSIPSKGLPDGFAGTQRKLKESLTILMVGTVEPRKGHEQVVKAFELLWMMGVNVNLVIVGKKGWMIDQLSTRMERHNLLNPRFFWYQGISDEALQLLYNAADGVVMASLGEGFGLPLIESAQHGCPILARDIPVFREVAGKHATYFSGTSSYMLAGILKSWIGKLEKRLAPQSSEMPWLTWKESVNGIVKLLTDNKNPQWLYRSEKIADPPKLKSILKTIAVDLTPVLQGGENGGAKVFVLELLRMLAGMKPETMFILLTRESAYEELAFLDRPNMRRVVALTDLPAQSNRTLQLENCTSLSEYFVNFAEYTGKVWKRSLLKRENKRVPPSKATLRELGVDLLFCPFTSLHTAEQNIPTVCTLYDLQYKTYPEFFDAEEVAHRDRVFMNACSHATLLTAISEYTRLSAIAHGNLDPARIRTISLRMANRFLLTCSHDKRTHKNVLARLGLTAQKYILYPANFWKHKNHEILLQAFYQACGNGIPLDIKLVCTGTPGDRQRLLIETAQSLGIGNRVIFPGYLSSHELGVVLLHSSGLIFPSLYEGFGLPIIEAMSTGIPVACSNTTALPEVSAGASLTFDPVNEQQITSAIVSLACDEKLRIKLVEAGFRRAAEFTNHERMANEYWTLFEDALSLSQRESAWVHWNKQNERSATKVSDLKVSIVTPSFNQGQFLERTLLSVQRQQGADVEHIVFDGGSTDNSVEVLQHFSPSVTWVSEQDKGQADAVNKGIRAAKGDIIGWLNSDDIYYPDAISHVLSFFEAHPDVDVVYGMADHIDVYDRPFESYPTEPWDFKRLHETCFICQPALFLRRRVVEQYGMLDDSLHYCMDYEYWLRLGKAGVRFGYIEKKLAGSRLYAENKTLGSRVNVHREINDMFKYRFGRVPKRWLQNYAHITMHERWKGCVTRRTEFDMRYFIARLRWNFPFISLYSFAFK